MVLKNISIPAHALPLIYLHEPIHTERRGDILKTISESFKMKGTDTDEVECLGML